MAKEIEGLYEMLKTAAEEEINMEHFQVEEKTVSYLVQYGCKVIMAYLDKVYPNRLTPVSQAPKAVEKEMKFVNIVLIDGSFEYVFLSDVAFERVDISPRALVEQLFGKYFPASSTKIKSYEVSRLQKVDSNDYK